MKLWRWIFSLCLTCGVDIKHLNRYGLTYCDKCAVENERARYAVLVASTPAISAIDGD